MRQALQADYTLVGGRLEPGVVVHLDGQRIARVQRGGGPSDAPIRRLSDQVLLPGFVNAHSHAFQRLMRGRTEVAVAGRDDFWSWRERLYATADALSPEQVEAACRLTFLEMLRAGFTHVVEFHYLHHGPGGQPYSDRLELSKRVLAAAQWAGIGITLLRVAYQRAGSGRAAQGAQLRFVDADLDAYAADLQDCRALAVDGPCPVQVGVAAHSVRALPRDWLRALPALAGDSPLHAHVAEQPREIAECLAETGRRPLQLLAELGFAEGRFTAVHATHLEAEEAALLGTSVACICPSTERNLGDGLPALEPLRAAGCTLALGTDSHAHIDPFYELRALEYGERLRSLSRNRMGPGAVAGPLFEAATAGGARAAGLDAGGIAEGQRADLVALDLLDPALVGSARGPCPGDTVLANLFLGGHPRLVSDVWVGGRHVLREGHCPRWEAACRGFEGVLTELA